MQDSDFSGDDARLCVGVAARPTDLANADHGSISCCHVNARTMFFDGREGTNVAPEHPSLHSRNASE
jgi:hypothetical protein